MSEECNHDFVHGAWSGPKCLLCHMRKEDCDRIEQLEGRLHDADLQGAKLKIRLNQIAIYPDPDFPAGDEAEEAKRAWQIIYILKGIAGGKE